MAQQPSRVQTSSLSMLHDHTQAHHVRQDSPGQVIGPSKRYLPDDTRHFQQTAIHVPGGIRTRNLSKRAAAGPRLRRRGHWHRPWWQLQVIKKSKSLPVLNLSTMKLKRMRYRKFYVEVMYHLHSPSYLLPQKYSPVQFQCEVGGTDVWEGVHLRFTQC